MNDKKQTLEELSQSTDDLDKKPGSTDETLQESIRDILFRSHDVDGRNQIKLQKEDDFLDQIKEQFQKMEEKRTKGFKNKKLSLDAREHLDNIEGQFVSQNHFVQNQGSFDNISENSCSQEKIQKVTVKLPENESRNLQIAGIFAMTDTGDNGRETPKPIVVQSGRSSMVRLEDTLKKKDLGQLIEYSMQLMDKQQPKFVSPKKVKFDLPQISQLKKKEVNKYSEYINQNRLGRPQNAKKIIRQQMKKKIKESVTQSLQKINQCITEKEQNFKDVKQKSKVAVSKALQFQLHHRSNSDVSKFQEKTIPAIPREVINLKVPEPVKVKPAISIKEITILTPLDVGKYLMEIQDFQEKQKTIINDAKKMFTRQTQQIMKLMELQVKYGINVVNPDDEITDFDLDKALSMQNNLDLVLSTMGKQNLIIPKCLKMFEFKYDIIEKEKLEKQNEQIQALKLKNDNYLKRLNIFKRNEKYQYQGYHALQAVNPYITGKQDKISKNVKDLGLARTHSQQILTSRIRFANQFRENPVKIKKERNYSVDMPNTQIMSANIKNDYINPFRNLTTRDIEKINQRIVFLKDKLFTKDKHIQDRVQQIHALTFFHQNQIDIFNNKISQKNYKINMIKRKFQDLQEKHREQIDKMHNFREQIVFEKSSEKNEEVPGTNVNFLAALEQNYKLEIKNRELTRKVEVLKSFIQQNDKIYNYSELKMIFLKLGNIFSKNKDPENILSEKSEKSGRKSMDVFSAKNDMRQPLDFNRKKPLCRTRTADKILSNPMEKIIKENILYPEVNDTQEDILEDFPKSDGDFHHERYLFGQKTYKNTSFGDISFSDNQATKTVPNSVMAINSPMVRAPVKQKAEIQVQGFETLKQEFGNIDISKTLNSPKNLDYFCSEQFKTPNKGVSTQQLQTFRYLFN